MPPPARRAARRPCGCRALASRTVLETGDRGPPDVPVRGRHVPESLYIDGQDPRQRKRRPCMPLHVSDAGRHITLVTIDNQSKRNAMPRATLAELAALWDRLEASADCR